MLMRLRCTYEAVRNKLYVASSNGPPTGHQFAPLLQAVHPTFRHELIHRRMRLVVHITHHQRRNMLLLLRRQVGCN
jgi:hypothetical protein